MLNPQGPKTEKENAVGPENGTANPHRLANATALVNEIAPNLQKGNKNENARSYHNAAWKL